MRRAPFGHRSLATENGDFEFWRERPESDRTVGDGWDPHIYVDGETALDARRRYEDVYVEWE